MTIDFCSKNRNGKSLFGLNFLRLGQICRFQGKKRGSLFKMELFNNRIDFLEQVR